MEIIKQYRFDEINVFYVTTELDNIGLILWPASAGTPTSERVKPDSMIQIKFASDRTVEPLSEGLSERNSESVQHLRLDRQESTGASIVSYLSDPRGHRFVHTLTRHPESNTWEVYASYLNESGADALVEMFHSISVSGIRTFQPDVGDVCGSHGLELHRFTSFWSLEGREQITPLEELGMEPSWLNQMARNERYGEVGSLPVRKYHPFGMLRDTYSGTCWAVMPEAPYSWELEAYTVDRSVSLSGGLAGYSFGHWRKTVKNGERFSTRKAFLYVGVGTMLDVNRAFVSLQRERMPRLSSEAAMPVIFNEYCTTWGKPDEEKVLCLAEIARSLGAEIFVMDCGWYRMPGINWQRSIGDWEYDTALFPHGFAYLTEKLRSMGLRPGIWFEAENCGETSKIYQQDEYLVHRNGIPFRVGHRSLMNLCLPATKQYLQERVIDFLKKNNFGYVKIDYNENIGYGCDHPDSFGEGGRLLAEASMELFGSMREQLPELLIENCASGGSRLEPARLSLCHMASFSDAHEGPEVPIIAASVCRLIPPEQSQIWVPVRRDGSRDRLIYSLCAAFYGRMCLSGDLDQLSQESEAVVKAGVNFYKKWSWVIHDGYLTELTNTAKYRMDMVGYQVGVLSAADTHLIIVHSFGQPEAIRIPLHGGKVVDSFGDADYTVQGSSLEIPSPKPFTAAIFVTKD